jgi:hypothetical protein
MIVIEPECRGTCTIDLEYGGATETRVARYLSLATTVMAPFLLFARRSRRTVGR